VILTSADPGDIVMQNDPICMPRPTFAEALPPVHIGRISRDGRGLRSSRSASGVPEREPM
jgi:hypothetical protein